MLDSLKCIIGFGVIASFSFILVVAEIILSNILRKIKSVKVKKFVLGLIELGLIIMLVAMMLYLTYAIGNTII